MTPFFPFRILPKAMLACFVSILFTSCSSRFVPAAMWPQSPEREATLEKYGDQWTREVPAHAFGLARSVGIVDSADTATPKTIPHGMAALVSDDGYALTANHVVNGENPGMIAAKHKNTLIPVHMSTVRMTLRDADGRVKAQHDLPGAFGYFSYTDKKRRKIDFNDVVIRPVRVVKRFKKMDLALVKTDVTPSAFFRYSERPVPKDTLFGSGNPFRYRASAAGEVIRKKTKEGAAISIHTSVPLSPGDSGSSVFDDQGDLVGITTDAFPKALLILPASIIRMINPVNIATAIAEDRAQNEGLQPDTTVRDLYLK